MFFSSSSEEANSFVPELLAGELGLGWGPRGPVSAEVKELCEPDEEEKRQDRQEHSLFHCLRICLFPISR